MFTLNVQEDQSCERLNGWVLSPHPLPTLGLNLIAITVFAVTLASLLGPWLHLSPLVPTLVTATILGLLTLDSLTFQGRGSTMVLDGLSQWTGGAPYRSRIIHHEAGHFLIAYLVGIPVQGYTLNAWEAFRQGQAGLGGVRFDSQALEAEIQQGQVSARLLDDYCTVWMAGIVAETLVYGTAIGGEDDRRTLRTLWRQIQRPASEAEQKQRGATLRAKTLLQEHWPAYEALVTAMTQKVPVADCCQRLAELTQASGSQS